MKNKKNPEIIGTIVLTAAALAGSLVQIFWDTEHPAKYFLCWTLLVIGALFFFLLPIIAYRKQHGSTKDILRRLYSDQLKTISVTCIVSEKKLGSLAPQKKAFSICLYDEIDCETLLRSHSLDAKKTDRKKADDAFRGSVSINLSDLLTLRSKTVILEQDTFTAMQALEQYQPFFKNNTVVTYNVLDEET